jgi:4-amino-4-deoxy-L-arabinose transferase-like glycosyltransferase
VALYLALRVPPLLGNSATYDEPIYLGAAKHFAVTGDDRAAALLYHPPLAYHLTSLPLWFLGTPLPAWEPSGANTQVGLDVLYGSTCAGSAVSPETVLLLARLPVLLAGLLGLPLLFALGRRLGGDAAGWIAAAGWACFPEAVSQSVQATTDCVAAVAAFGLALAALRHLDAVRALRGSGADGPSTAVDAPSGEAASRARRTLVVLGAAAGLALLAKHSLVVHVAVVVAALLLLRALSWRSLVAGAGIAAAVVWAGYLFELRPALAGDGPHRTLDAVARRLGLEPATLEGPARALPVPAPTYFRSLADALLVKAQARSGTLWSAYQDGAWSDRGFWTYFPYATVVKSPLAFLAAAAVGLAGLRRVLSGRRAETAFLLALFAVPFASAVVSRLNIGFRHVLPALPFLFVVAAAGLARLCTSPARTLAAAALLAIEPFATVRDPIPYANVLAGGPARLHERLADSNLEMGQDLRRVTQWARDTGVERLVAYLHGPPGLVEREAARDPLLATGGEAPSGGLFREIADRPERQAQDPAPGDTCLAVGESVLVTRRWSPLLGVTPLAVVGRTRIYVVPR